MATGRMIINILSPKVFIYLNDDALLLWLLYTNARKEVKEKNKNGTTSRMYTQVAWYNTIFKYISFCCSLLTITLTGNRLMCFLPKNEPKISEFVLSFMLKLLFFLRSLYMCVCMCVRKTSKQFISFHITFRHVMQWWNTKILL